MVFFEYWHKEPGIAGELCDLLEASGQVVPEDLRRIAQEVEAGAVGGWMRWLRYMENRLEALRGNHP